MSITKYKEMEMKAKKYETSTFRWILLLVIFALATNLALLHGIRSVCGPPPVSCVSTPIKRNAVKDWNRKETDAPEEQLSHLEPSFCSIAWDVWDGLHLHQNSSRDECEAMEEELVKKQNLLQKIASIFHGGRTKQRHATNTDEFTNAFSTDLILTASQLKITKTLAERFRRTVNDPRLDSRLAAVSWGGPGGPRWWSTASHGKGVHSVDGGNLLARYLRIMKWPQDMVSHFPFKLCSKGCDAVAALEHTLEWREKYKPWLVSPSVLKENRKGFVYLRGRSPSLRGDHAGHSVVWWRTGVHAVENPEAYFRAVLNALEMSVADNLHRSHNKVGKFNVVIDAAGVSFSMLPKIGEAKRAITMLQDHFPDRLGMVFIGNLSKAAEFLLGLVKPLITKEVRDKIKSLPSDPAKRKQMLETVVESEFIPDYLGGVDTYRFDVNAYYDKRHRFTETEGTAYLQTMPYHA